MALTSIRSFLTFSILYTLFSTAMPSGSVQAKADGFNRASLPSLEAFIEQVGDGPAGELRGVYITGILAAPIVQQPDGMDDFVSPWQNVVTQFSLASRFGSTGLLAHNYLAGEWFDLLQKGQEIHLVFGDGQIDTYIVSDIQRYQALESVSISSAFKDLENQGLLSYSDLFTRVYNRPGQVVFQTCIEMDDDPAWGRLFVIAEKSS